jgi:hypothetical protein
LKQGSQLSGLTWVETHRGVAARFAQTTAIGDQDNGTSGHRLNSGQTEAFGMAWDHNSQCVAVGHSKLKVCQTNREATACHPRKMLLQLQTSLLRANAANDQLNGL